jgi:hypothetical protein
MINTAVILSVFKRLNQQLSKTISTENMQMSGDTDLTKKRELINQYADLFAHCLEVAQTRFKGKVSEAELEKLAIAFFERSLNSDESKKGG